MLQKYYKISVDNKSFWAYNTYMNSKITRKRRTDRNQVIYFIQDKVTLEYYIGLTAVCYAGNVRKTLVRRMQKHMQRAMTENKNWGLSRALREQGAERFVFGVIEVVRGKRPAHARETEFINTMQPALNTFGVK
tara:strand:- start:134 stop:535 length:402 start_codon:yes stop_codon:yes gene_type:complete